MQNRYRMAGGVRAILGGVCVATALFVGCSSGQKNLAEQQSNMKPLGILLAQFASQHQGQAPASEAEFKAWLKSLPANQLSVMAGGKTDVDALFVSTRDNKPYVIRYGKEAQSGPRGGPAGDPVVIYEQEGVGGRRFVGTLMGAVEAVDEAQFKQLVPGAP